MRALIRVIIDSYMRKKEAQIRRKARESQLDQIKASIRQTTLKSYCEAQKVQQWSQVLQQHIRKNNIDQIFELLVKSEHTVEEFINSQTVVDLYLLISSKTISLKELLILQKLIEVHFDILFQRQELMQTNRAMTQMVTNGVMMLAERIHREQIDQHGAASCGLNAYLSIIKTLHSRLSYKMKGDSEEQIFKMLAGDLGKIVSLGQCLLQNENYLSLLNRLIALNEISFKQNNYLVLFQNNSHLMKIVEMARQVGKKGQNAYNLLNSIIQLTDLDVQLAERIIPEVVGIVLEKGKTYLRKINRQNQNNLYEGIDSLHIILSFLNLKSSSVGSSSPCFHLEYFQLLLTLLNTEQQNKKVTIFHLIQQSIKIIAQHYYHSVLNYISPQSFQQLAIALKNSGNIALQIIATKLLQMILRLPSHSPQQLQSAIYQLYSYDIPQTLECLQYNKNQELSMISIDLLENQFQEQQLTYGESVMNYADRQNFL